MKESGIGRENGVEALEQCPFVVSSSCDIGIYFHHWGFQILRASP